MRKNNQIMTVVVRYTCGIYLSLGHFQESKSPYNSFYICMHFSWITALKIGVIFEWVNFDDFTLKRQEISLIPSL